MEDQNPVETEPAALPDAPRNKFGWNAHDLMRHFIAAKDNGWLPLFEAAALATRQPTEDDPEPRGVLTQELIALCSRESGPFWKAHPDGKIIGDHGHAFGLAQVNVDSHAGNGITEPADNLAEGARILAEYRKALSGKRPPITGSKMQEAVYCSYNRGVNGAYKSWRQYGDPNKVTAHQDYGADCVAREAVFAGLLANEGIE